jgi:hypothetical protein
MPTAAHLGRPDQNTLSGASRINQALSCRMRPISIIIRSMKKGSPDIVFELKRKIAALEKNARETSRIIGELIGSANATLHALQTLKDISGDHSAAISKLFAMHETAPHETERLH